MIEIANLYKTFHAGKVNEVKALQGLNVKFNAGEFVIVIGSNGSGKSTLLNCISGNIFPNGGSIIIDGNEVTRLAEHKRSKWIARVFQNPLSGTASDLSILENFRLAALRTTNKNLSIGINNDFTKLVKDKISMLGMGLENKILQPMGTLSGGQRQALTLLMAVMDDVKILLLDEPTAALDPRSAEIVMEIANKLISDYKLTAILITHSMKEAYQYGNRIIQMAEGKVIRDLSKEEKVKITHNELYGWFM
jgi:putative ABC transport system ATP-binding protein